LLRWLRVLTLAEETMPEQTTPDLNALKSRQQDAWSSGDYGIIGTTAQIVGETLCEAIDLRAGSRVLDVAAGNGNASLAAARRWCEVVSTDYVPGLLELGRKRAEGERLSIQFREADAEHLPFPDSSFDAVLSTFGVMFAPDQARAASELLRVCRQNGKIGLANWTPDSFVGQLFRLLGKHIPPPTGVKPPSLWGTEAHLRELFAAGTATISTQARQFRLPLPLAGPLAGSISQLLRSPPQGLRRAAARRASRSRD
jgi:SAM-dependent methyltransferase